MSCAVDGATYAAVGEMPRLRAWSANHGMNTVATAIRVRGSRGAVLRCRERLVPRRQT
jgi:hypothetical protein